MGQRLTGRPLPAAAAYGDAVMDLDPDESELVLLKHCRDMKQQETRLRRITLLLLLLGAAALLAFTCWAALRCEHTPSGHGMNTVIGDGLQLEEKEKSPAFSKQQRVFPTDAQTNRLRIDLSSKFDDHSSDPRYVQWNFMFGERYNEEKRAIVIPEDGFYFVYVRIALSCHNDQEASDFKTFNAVLHRLNEAYNTNVTLMEAREGVACAADGHRSLFVGQLCDLLKGDHVSVWIRQGYRLITKAAFGAFLA